MSGAGTRVLIKFKKIKHRMRVKLRPVFSFSEWFYKNIVKIEKAARSFFVVNYRSGNDAGDSLKATSWHTQKSA